jgi:hypothetical protein
MGISRSFQKSGEFLVRGAGFDGVARKNISASESDATPCKGTAAAESIAVATQSETSESAKTALRENVRKILHERLRLGRFGIRPIGPQ